jgi:hypothetical protein
VSREISSRLTKIFLRDERSRRQVYGGSEKFQTDPYWRDHILFDEYFHGDNGADLGASHQTAGRASWRRRFSYTGFSMQSSCWKSDVSRFSGKQRRRT